MQLGGNQALSLFRATGSCGVAQHGDLSGSSTGASRIIDVHQLVGRGPYKSTAPKQGSVPGPTEVAAETSSGTFLAQ
jgi:hypothetical protein